MKKFFTHSHMLRYCCALGLFVMALLVSTPSRAGVCYTTQASGNWSSGFNLGGNGISSTAVTTAANIASTQYWEFDAIAGQTYSFKINAGSGWTTPAYQYYEYNGSAWVYKSGASVASGTAFTITPLISDPSLGAGWHLIVIFNGTSCSNVGGPAWPGTSCSLTYQRTTGPIPTGASVSSSCWNTDASTTYTVSGSAINSSNVDYGGGPNGYGIMTLINYQGTNGGNYGGYFDWAPSIAKLNAGGYTLNQSACTSGPGFVGQASGFNNAGVTLVSGSSSVSNYTTTANFVVRPNTSFPQATAINAVSVYAGDNAGNVNGWNNYQLNFASSYATAGGLSSASPASGTTICAGFAVSANGTAGSGGSGGTDAWRYSINNGTSWTAIANNGSITTTGATGNVIVQTQRTTTCATSAWTQIAIWPVGSTNVAPTLNTATPGSGNTVCQSYGNVSATINAGSGGSSGAADLYEYSINGGTSWATYTSGTNIPTASATTSIQVRVSRSAGTAGCSATGPTVVATWPIGATNTAPTLNTATPASGNTVCQNYGNVKALINAGSGGSQGAADSYEYSINGGTGWAAYTSNTNIPTASATTSIQVRVSRSAGSYGCSSTGPTVIATWPVNATNTAPTLNVATPASGSTVCTSYGTVNATITAGSGGSQGAADSYEYTTNGGTSWSAYTSGTGISTASATTSIQVRVSRSAGSYGCSATGPTVVATWPIGTSTVAPVLNTATPASATTVCTSYGSVSATVTAGSGGSSGAADSYEFTTNGGTSWSAYSSGNAISTASATTSIQVRVSRSAGSYGCSATGPTVIATWPIGATNTAPVLNVATPVSGSTVCTSYGTVSATITAGSGGSSGAADSYEFSINGGTSWSAYTSGNTISTASATTSIQVRVSRSAGSYGCSATGPTVVATWPIGTTNTAPTLNTATPASATTVCTSYGTVNATVTAGSGGSSGAADSYEYTTNGGTSWSAYTSGNTISTASATTSIQVRVSRSAGSYGCAATGPTVIATWPIGATNTAPTLNLATPASGLIVCTDYGVVKATITAGSGGSTGAADSYQYSTDGGSTWSAYTSGTNIATSGSTTSIQVRVSRSAGSYGCSATGPTVIATWTVGSAPAAPTLNVATPASGTPLCSSYGNVNATATAGSGGSTGAVDAYQYSVNGGTSWSAYTPGTNIPTSSATGSIIIQSRRVTGSYGCVTTAWGTIASWSISQGPTAGAGSTTSASVCTSAGFYDIPTGYTAANGTISWLSSGDGTFTSGATTTTPRYTLGTNDLASGGVMTLTMHVANSPCTDATAVFTLTINVTPVPTFTTIPANPSCNYTNVTYTTQPGKSSYNWTGFGTAGVDYNVISGGISSTDNTVTLQWISTGTKAVRVAYSFNGCPSVGFAANATVINASPTPTINTNGAYCTSTSIVYSTQTGQTGYIWSTPGSSAGTDYTVLGGGTSTDDSYTLQWITTGPRTVTVNYTNASGCPGITAGSASGTVTVAPTSVAISDVIDGCNGGHTANVVFTGGIAPYRYTVFGTPYTGMAATSAIDATNNSSATLSLTYDGNGCVPGTTVGNPVTYPTRTLTAGGSTTCTVATSTSKIYYDNSGNLMVKITDLGNNLGSTQVDATVDPILQKYGPTNRQSYLQRHFKISPTNNTTGTATVCMYMSDAEVQMLHDSSATDNHSTPSYYPTFQTTLSNAVVTKFHGAGETPTSNVSRQVLTPTSKTHNPTVNGVVYNNVWEVCMNVTSWSGFYVHGQGGSNNPLPVTMLYLTADVIDNKYIQLDWATASEINNQGFEIQRSTDGTSFERIGWVDGHGTSNSTLYYSSDDKTVQPGVVYYYRLKQVDIDGNFVYTEIVSASLIGDKGFVFEDLIPNPAINSVQLGILTATGQKANVVITDVLGRVVINTPWQLAEGYNISTFDISSLSEGAYNVTVYSGATFTTKRLVVTR